jgi:hypothetical protein
MDLFLEKIETEKAPIVSIYLGEKAEEVYEEIKHNYCAILYGGAYIKVILNISEPVSASQAFQMYAAQRTPSVDDDLAVHFYMQECFLHIKEEAKKGINASTLIQIDTNNENLYYPYIIDTLCKKLSDLGYHVDLSYNTIYVSVPPPPVEKKKSGFFF